MKAMKLILMAIAAGVLVACGGGGDGDVPLGPTTWQEAQILEDGAGISDSVSVAINAEGVGHAVWLQRASGVENDIVFARGYRNGVWGPVQRVGDNDQAYARAPQVVVLPDGEALTVWLGVTANEVLFSRTVGGVWKKAEPIPGSQGNGSMEELKLAANEQGVAVAVWRQSLSASANPKTRGVTFRNGVFTPVQDVSFGTAFVSEVDVAVDAQGNALAVWVQNDSQTNVRHVFARANVGGVWQSGNVELNPLAVLDAKSPQVAVGLDGAASVVWTEDGKIKGRNATNFLTKQWAFSFLGLDGSAGSTFDPIPHVVLDRDGVITVVWNHVAQGALDEISTVRSARGKGAAPFAFEDVETFEATAGSPDIAMDLNGRVMVVWHQQERGSARTNMLFSRLDPVSGKWSLPALIENENSSDMSSASLAMNTQGQAVAAWRHFASGSDNANLMANVFK